MNCRDAIILVYLCNVFIYLWNKLNQHVLIYSTGEGVLENKKGYNFALKRVCTRRYVCRYRQVLDS